MKLLELEKLINSEYFWLGDTEINGSTLTIKDVRDGYTFELTIQEEDNLYHIKKKMNVLGEETTMSFSCKPHTVDGALHRIAVSLMEADKAAGRVIRDSLYDIFVTRRMRVDTVVTKKKKEVFDFIFGQLTLSIDGNIVKIYYKDNTDFKTDKWDTVECEDEDVAFDTYNYSCYLAKETVKTLKSLYSVV
jgi:hypothetical protein